MEERNQGTKTSQEINYYDGIIKYLPIDNYSKCNWIYSPAKGIEWMDGFKNKNKTKQNNAPLQLLLFPQETHFSFKVIPMLKLKGW